MVPQVREDGDVEREVLEPRPVVLAVVRVEARLAAGDALDAPEGDDLGPLPVAQGVERRARVADRGLDERVARGGSRLALRVRPDGRLAAGAFWLHWSPYDRVGVVHVDP